MLPFVFEPGLGYENYVSSGRSTSRCSSWCTTATTGTANGLTFRRFLAEGFEGERATLHDWDRHLTTLFPDVRLKRILEVRGADAVPPGLTCALPALWKGILYDAGACGAGLASSSPAGPSPSARRRSRRWRGAASPPAVAGRPVLALARELVEIARAGLARIGDGQGGETDERGFLDPLLAVAERGKSPGEEVLARWEGAWRGSPERLIEYARY